MFMSSSAVRIGTAGCCSTATAADYHSRKKIHPLGPALRAMAAVQLYSFWYIRVRCIHEIEDVLYSCMCAWVLYTKMIMREGQLWFHLRSMLNKWRSMKSQIVCCMESEANTHSLTRLLHPLTFFAVHVIKISAIDVKFKLESLKLMKKSALSLHLNSERRPGRRVSERGCCV